MPNIARLLREEIQRLAKKQIKTELGPIKRENVRLKRSVAELRRQIASLNRLSVDLAKKVTPVVALKQAEQATQVATKLRPTGSSMRRLRRRLGLTQEQYGKLLGVSAQAIVQTEGRTGRLRLRKSTLAALAALQKIGKREARRRLETLAAAKPAKAAAQAPAPRKRKARR